jgi:hypothetical protein
MAVAEGVKEIEQSPMRASIRAAATFVGKCTD